MSQTAAHLSLGQARRLVIAAQGLNRSGKAEPTLKKILLRLGVLQIDSVNVLVRAHYLPLFSRRGPYPAEDLDQLTWGPAGRRVFFEYWGHEASFLPLEHHALFRWRMGRAARGEGIYQGLAKFGREERDLVRRVLRMVAERGPVGAGALGGRSTGPWWGWSPEKAALEWLFAAGEVTVAGRKGFERLYDLPERVLPRKVLRCAEPGEAEAQRRLLWLAAASLGLGTGRDLRDYFRLPAGEAKARLAELVEAGDLATYRVEGWAEPAYGPAGLRAPRKVATGSLISPFDSLIWERSRTERLFDFRYRLEFYTPPAKRIYGYHVLPFLFGERLVSRVDLKADRAAGRLLVPALFAEGDLLTDEALSALARNLADLAGWLNLGRLAVRPRGPEERRLARELKPIVALDKWPE